MVPVTAGVLTSQMKVVSVFERLGEGLEKFGFESKQQLLRVLRPSCKDVPTGEVSQGFHGRN